MHKFFFLLLFFPVFALAGVNKCVNDGKVVYSELPCVSGAVVYNADRVSVADGSVRTATASRGADGTFSLMGVVNGQPVNFMLDTGASFTTISGDLAYRLGVRSCVPAGVFKTGNGNSAYCRITLSRLSVAGFNFVNVSVAVSPAMSTDALFGNDLLSHFLVIQKNGVMTLSR